MSKKFNKIMSVVLALMMVCSLLPMSVMAAENDTYTVTFAPGTLCRYTGEGEYPTSTYDGTGEFKLPEPADLGLVGSLDNIDFQGWTLEGGDGTVYEADADVASLITGNVTFLANYVAVVTFEPGRLCAFVPDLSVEEPDYNYVTAIYNGTGVITLPDPADVRIFPYNEDRMIFDNWIVKGTTEPVYSIGEDVTDLITGNISFVANFKEKPVEDTVTYYIEPGQIGSFENQTVTIGPIPTEYLTATSLPITDEGIENEMRWTIPDDLTFDHWEGPNGTISNGENGRTVDFDPVNGAHYIAYWSEKGAQTYTVTLNPGTIGETAVPGTPLVQGPFEAGTEYKMPAADTFTYPGYRIIGWRYTNNELASFPIVLNSDVELYAVWTAVAEQTWTITYNAGEGASFREDVAGYEYEDGKLITTAARGLTYNLTLPDANEKILEDDVEVSALFLTMPENMEFEGWSDGTNTYYSGQVITVTADTTFTALWRAEGAGPYNVILNAGSMSQYTEGEEDHYNRDYAVKVDAGGNYTLPANMDEITALGWTIPEGYEFAGWVLPSTLDEPVTEVTNVRADVTVIALWREETVHAWTVSFDANGGTGAMEPVVVTTDANTYPYYLPTNNFTAPAGMEFDYWTVSGFEDKYQPGDVVNISSDVTVTAHWKSVTYYYFLVSFDANGGSGEMAPLFLESTTTSVEFTVPTSTFTPPEGKIFAYWIDEKNNYYFPNSPATITESVTLIAQWIDIPTVNFTQG